MIATLESTNLKYILLTIINYIYICYLQLNLNHEYPMTFRFSFEGLMKSSQISSIFLCTYMAWIWIYFLHVNFIVIPFYISIVSFPLIIIENVISINAAKEI